MNDKKSFLSLVLDFKGLNMNQAAVLLEWDPARVWYLCSGRSKGFPLAEIPNLKDKLNIGENKLMTILKEYLFNK